MQNFISGCVVSKKRGFRASKLQFVFYAVTFFIPNHIVLTGLNTIKMEQSGPSVLAVGPRRANPLLEGEQYEGVRAPVVGSRKGCPACAGPLQSCVPTDPAAGWGSGAIRQLYRYGHRSDGRAAARRDCDD